MSGPFHALAGEAILRTAEPRDVPGILALIRELAIYEREPDAVVNTETRLSETLFRPSPSVHAHVVDRGGDIVGTAVWFLNYSTWTGRNGIYLEDLIVRESERGLGYGLALIRELARICVDRDYTRFEWSVLDWNEPSIRFYRSIGARPMDEWTVQRLEGEALRALSNG